jgi:glycosyltransferase involved in cell wall biosynthesis
MRSDTVVMQMARSRHTPRVSIGMPVYNGGAFLEEALRSVVNQKFRDFEVILSDNGSTDDTRSIAEAFAARDSRITYVRQPRNRGAARNFNLVYEQARGPYFKWANHDDVLAPGYLDACVAALDAEPDALVCQSLLEYIDAQGSNLGGYDSRLRATESADPAARFGAVVLLPHPNYEVLGVIRRRALEGTMLFAGFHGDDKALLAELALRGRFTQVRRPLMYVRDHAGRYTRSKFRPRDRQEFHTPDRAHGLCVPTLRLYREYVGMIARTLPPGRCRTRCHGVLLRWWLHNWNAVRVAVDVLALFAPGVVERAIDFKQRLISPLPGAGEAQERNVPRSPQRNGQA